MAFPPQFLDELRARLLLSDLVGKRIKIQRAGREYKACCPFHKEKTPSFTINDQKGFFHCFGCGAHGDIVGFAMRHDNLEFPEAVEMLAGLAGLAVPRIGPEDDARQQRHRRLQECLEAAAAWFAHRLQDQGPAGAGLRYLRARGIDDATLALFRLGYAPADGSALRQHLLKAGYGDAEMMEIGLVRQSDTGRDPYSFFRDRVIIPITDGRDRVIAFGARLLAGEGPKYLNSADSPLFRKGETLFNLAKARQAARDGEPFLVVEGYFDVISLVRAGFRSAVAPLGTALTDAQMQQVWRAMRPTPEGIRAPLLCLDGDNAGRTAAHRFAERSMALIEPDRTVRFAFLPQGQDPDSLLRQADGAAQLRTCLANAEPLVDFLWSWKLAEKSYDTPEERASLRKYFLNIVANIQDRSLQQLYRDEFLNRCFELWKVQKREDVKVVALPAKTDGRRLIIPSGDIVLISALINQPTILEEFLASLDQIHFGESGHTHTIFRFASRILWETPGLTGKELQDQLAGVDAMVSPIVNRLNIYYKTHVNIGDRGEDYVREVFIDVLRSQQLLRLREDLFSALQRQLVEDLAEEDRIRSITAEMRRLQGEQDYVLDQHPAPYLLPKGLGSVTIGYACPRLGDLPHSGGP